MVPETGFTQVLLESTVPSLKTSIRETIRVPFASGAVEQGRVVVRCSVKVQFPVACAAVIVPPPPKVAGNGSALFSHPAKSTIVVNQRTDRFT
jgi:hypothetical protein